MFKMTKILSVIIIFAMLISTFNFTVLAEEITYPITVTNAQPYTYEISPALTKGRYKITTSFDLSALSDGSTFPEQGILVKDSSDNNICGLKIAPYENLKFSVMVGNKSWVIYKARSNFGTYTLEMIIDIDSDTVMYTLSGENVTFESGKVFYGYFELADGKLTTKRPVPLGTVSDVAGVKFYRNTRDGEFIVKSLDIAEDPATSTVTYASSAWSGSKTIKELGLDDSYSYGNKFPTGDVTPSSPYTVEYKDDCISVKGGGTVKKAITGITKKFDAVKTGDTVIVKTGFYSGTQGNKDVGFGTAIRLVDSTRTNASYSLAVGKKGGSTDGYGVAMRWDNVITANDFATSYVILNRSSGATLDADTWYDLTLEINRKSDTSATINATMEWDVPKDMSDEEYLKSFTTSVGLTVKDGKATLTKSGTTTKPNIDSIELLQSIAGDSYVGSTSKFKKVWTNKDADVTTDATFNIDSYGRMGQSSVLTTKISSDEPVEAMLVRACYAGSGSLRWVETEKNVIVGTTTFGTMINNEANAPQSGDTIKLFLFDKNLRPLVTSPAKTFSSQSEEDEVIVPDGGEYMPSTQAIEAALEKQRGVHPRITFDKANIEKVKQNIDDPDYAFIADNVCENWQTNLTSELYVYKETDESPQRTVGDTMQSLALAYKITDNETYYNRCLEWIELALSMPRYGKQGIGIAASHILSGLARTYDLLYDDLSDDMKSRMKATMLEKGALLWTRAEGEDAYNENIAYTVISAFADLALCLFDEPGCEEAAMEWLLNSQRFVACSMQVMSPDGCSPEGTGYFGYGFNSLGKFCEVAEKWGFDPFKCEGFVNSLNKYRIYMSLPRNSWTKTQNTVSIGDAEGFDYGSLVWMMYWYGTKGYDNGSLNWLATELRTSGCGGTTNVRELLYYDKTAPLKDPGTAGYPTMGDMRDYGYVFTRPDWSGDGSAIYFQCGFNNGEHAIPYLRAFPEDPDFGHGHNDPSANDFVLYHNGDMLLKDDYYSWKMTGQHNTLLVDGKGQLGEGEEWYLEKNNQEDFDINGPMPHVKTAESYDDYDYFVGSAEAAYYKSQELKKFDRHMLYIKPNVLVVIDDIATNTPKDLELRFITGARSAFEAGNGFIANGSKTTMYVENLTPDEMDLTLSKKEVWINQEKRGLRGDKTFAANANKSEVTNVTLFSWCDKGDVPAKVEMRRDGDNYYFTTEGKEYCVNIANLSSSVKQAASLEADAKLEILTVQDINVPLKDGVYDYDFNLDDYYINARNNNMSITAIDTQFNKENAEVVMPDEIPGKAYIYVKNGSKTNTYTVNLSKTTPEGITRVEMTPIDDTNTYSPGFVPSYLLDGSLSSCFRTGTRANHPIFDMGEVKKVCGFDIAWRDTADTGFNVTILASKDGENFEEIYSGVADTSIENTVYTAFDKEYEARYIEFIPEIGDNSYNYSYCLSEFGIYTKNN